MKLTSLAVNLDFSFGLRVQSLEQGIVRKHEIGAGIYDALDRLKASIAAPRAEFDSDEWRMRMETDIGTSGLVLDDEFNCLRHGISPKHRIFLRGNDA